MCNDYEQHILYAEYCKMMQELALGIPSHQSELDLPRADDIKIGDIGPVMRAASRRGRAVAYAVRLSAAYRKKRRARLQF